MQISAGVDISMAVSTKGDVFSWGKTSGGRTGLSVSTDEVTFPTKVKLKSTNDDELKAIDVECGYMHSLVIALDGTIHMCGGVGTDGSSDGQSMRDIADGVEIGTFQLFSNFRIKFNKDSPIVSNILSGRPAQVPEFVSI